jgi:antitoxin component of MazEF toxin-antitoxin module
MYAEASMVVDSVKARRVAQSLVVTLTAKILEQAHIEEGDEMVLETIAEGAVLVRKADSPGSSTRRILLELDLLEKQKLHAQRRSDLLRMRYEYANDSGGWDGDLLEWQSADVDLAAVDASLAKKRLELYDLTGEADFSKALEILGLTRTAVEHVDALLAR